MISALLFLAFIVLLLMGVPIGAALGLAGAVCIALANARCPVVRTAGGAAELLRRPGQVPAAGDPDVRAGRIDLRALRRRPAAGQLRAGDHRPRPGHAAAGDHRGGHVHGRHLGLGPGDGGRGGRRDDRRDGAGRLSGRVLGQRGRRGGRHRHPDPAVDRLHRLFGAGARRLGAGAVRRRHVPGHPRRSGADDPGRLAVAPARHGQGRIGFPAAAVLAQPARGQLGPVRAGADPGRHARRHLHAHRGRGDGGVLRPVRRHGRSTGPSGCATCSRSCANRASSPP